MVAHFQVLGGTRCSISEMASGPSHSHPLHQQLHEEGTVHTPILLCAHPPKGHPAPTGVCLPPPHLVSLPAGSSRCLLRSACPSLSLCYLVCPPTGLSFHLPATLPVHALAVHLSPSFCLSVPDQRLTQLLTLFVPAHAIFPGWGKGTRKSWGGAPSNPGETLVG